MKCEQCGKEFESKRKTAKYCSAKCRKLAFQGGGVSVPENGKTGVSVPETVSVPRLVVEDGRLRLPNHYQYHAPGKDNRDNPYHPDYDLSEEGFKRRNKNWAEFSKPFREMMMVAGRRIHDARVNG